MRFHVGNDPAENYAPVLGGPWTWEVTDATEYDWGIRLECTAQDGDFVGRRVSHGLSASEKSGPFVLQWLLAAGYPGAENSDELDIETGELIGLKFSAKARKQRNNPEYSELYYFESLDDAESDSLKP
jgi:hypothetical protein